MKTVLIETFETYGPFRVADSATQSTMQIDGDVETAIRAELCVGPYIEGKTQRVVHVMIDGKAWGKYSATRWHKFN